MPNPGLSPAIQQAMQRRGMGSPDAQLNQTSPQAAMANPGGQPPNPSELNQSPQVQPSAPKFEPGNEQEFIVAALAERLKDIGKTEKEKLKLASGQAQPSQPQPSAPAMGGGYPIY